MGNQSVIPAQHAGQWKRGMYVSEDRNILKAQGAGRRKHSRIMVWHKDHINGLEIFYGKKSTGVRGGKDYKLSPCQVVTLGSNEFITCVAGTKTEAIDELIFYTNKGNIFKTGVNKGGTPFTLSQGGDKFVVYFSIGMEEYLTYVKVDFRYLPSLFGHNTAPFCHVNNMAIQQRAVYPPIQNSLVQRASVQPNIPVQEPISSVQPIPAVGGGPSRLKTERISAPLPEKLFQPSINQERGVQSDCENSDEESKYDHFEDEMKSSDAL